MYSLATGDRIEKYRGAWDGVIFDMADDGGTLLVLFRNPSADSRSFLSLLPNTQKPPFNITPLYVL